MPRSVALVAMGKSFGTYVFNAAKLGNRRLLADETWAIVAMAGVVQHDRLFLMDDIPGILEPTIKTDKCMAGMWGWLKKHPGPIYSSKAYPKYPGVVEYPLHDVVKSVGIAYFSTSVAYAIGYAIHIGVKQLQLYGCDFTYPDRHISEAGRACCEFLLSVAMSHDIEIVIAADSTLMDVSQPKRRLYGYVDPPQINLRTQEKEAA